MLKPKRKLQDATLSNEQAATIALEEARKIINETDSEMAKLFERRMDIY